MGGVGEQAHSGALMRPPTCAHRHLRKWLMGLAWAISALTAVLTALTIVLAARWRPSIVHKSSNLVCRFDQLLPNPRSAHSSRGAAKERLPKTGRWLVF